MKKVFSFLCRMLGVKKYRYYIIVVTEKYRMNNEQADSYLSGYIFPSEKDAQVYAAWLLENTVMFDKACIRTWDSDHRHLCASLGYPRCPEDKLKVTYVEPLERA